MRLTGHMERIVAAAMVVFVVAAALMSSDLPGKLTGDINSDQAVDVCDVQLAIARLLSSSGADQPSDTSILDIQRALDQAGQPARPLNANPAKSVCKGILVGPQVSPAPSFAIWQPREIVLPVPIPSSDCVCSERIVVPVVTERYIFRLTSNAPPASA